MKTSTGIIVVIAIFNLVSVLGQGSTNTEEPMVECTVNSECSGDLACINNKCEDPCAGGVCGPNTNCEAINHNPICTCQPGFTGDPDISCTRIEVETTTTEKPGTECTVNSECSGDLACINNKCEDPCAGGVCGPNTNCEAINHNPICSCQPGFTGDPDISCTRI